MSNILFTTAQELATSIRRGQVSAIEVLEAHRKQIARYNPQLNANDLLALNPGGEWGYSGGCAKEQPRAESWPASRAGWRTSATCCRTRRRTSAQSPRWQTSGGRSLIVRCDHGGVTTHTYLADPDGYVVKIQYGR